MGRASEFKQETADAICARMAAGESVRSICRDDAMPVISTVFKWLSQQPTFAEQYAHAREVRAETIFEECLEIADESSRDVIVDEDGHETVNQEVVQRARLRVDTRKWMLGKMLPKKYGEAQQIKVSGPNGETPREWVMVPTKVVGHDS